MLLSPSCSEVNRFRPSIDVLFRSAACLNERPRVGVLLSGYLYDGVDGLDTLVRHGGQALIQDPEDATARQLLDQALSVVEHPVVTPANQLAFALRQMLLAPASTHSEECTEALKFELDIDASITSHADALMQGYPHAGVSCPDCGGPMWRVSEQHIRCHVGHAYNAHSWLEGQDEALERALWSALRIMEEKARMLDSLPRRAGEANTNVRLGELKNQIGEIRDLLHRMSGVKGAPAATRIGALHHA